MSMKIKFNPFTYEVGSDLQEKIKLPSPTIHIQANLEVYAVVNKGNIYYSGKTAIQGDDVEVYITRPHLMLLTDDNGQELSGSALNSLKQMKGIVDLIAKHLQEDLEAGHYDDQILNQKDKSSKHKVTPEEISSGNLRPSPNNGLRTMVQTVELGASNRDLIYDLMRNSKQDLTVGELTEQFNTDHAVIDEDPLPRNEVAKLVTSLKAEGLVRPVRRRVCSVAGREVLTWTTDMTQAPTEEVIQLAKKKMDDAKERYELAQAEYQALINQANLSED
jgi:hypothetical protein